MGLDSDSPGETPRRHTRVPCTAAAIITTDGGTVSGVCENLSLGGAFVNCEPVPPGDSVSVTLCLPSLGPVELTGKVLRREARGCGIRFTHLASTALIAICTYIGTVS